MKTHLLLVLTLLSACSAFSQELVEDEGKPLAFKFAPASLSVGKTTIGIEYNLGNRNSVTLVVGAPTGKTRQLTYDGSQADIKSKATSLMAGYRRYLGQKNMKGFYFEPYVKYLKHDATGVINADLNSGTMMFDSHSSYSGVGVGAQIGLQLIISRSIVVDLFLLGPEVNKGKHTFFAKDISNNTYWTIDDEKSAEAKVRELLTNVPLIGNSINVKVDGAERTIATDYSGIIPGLRVGGSIGVRF